MTGVFISYRGREAGAFLIIVYFLQKYLTETPLLPSTKPEKIKQCHPESAVCGEGSPNPS
jgi:hypothetical protein